MKKDGRRAPIRVPEGVPVHAGDSKPRKCEEGPDGAAPQSDEKFEHKLGRWTAEKSKVLRI